MINTFTVEADKADAVVASLRDVMEKVTRTLPGFNGASIHKSTDGEHIANYVLRETLDDFQAMFADPRVRARMAEVAALSVGHADRLHRGLCRRGSTPVLSAGEGANDVLRTFPSLPPVALPQASR